MAEILEQKDLGAIDVAQVPQVNIEALATGEPEKPIPVPQVNIEALGGPISNLNSFITEGKVNKYREGFIPGVSMDGYYEAANQSRLQGFGNAFINTLSEAAFGTLEGIGYLTDVPAYLDLLQKGEVNFENWFSEFAVGAKEKIKEDFAPVYDSPHSKGFSPFNWRWYANNASTLGTMFGLLIPSIGVGKGAGLLLKNANKLTQGQKLATSGLAGAVASRHMESMMEAAQLGQSMRDQGTYTEEEIAKAQAASYKTNWLALTTDLLQYPMLFVGGSKALKQIFSRSAAVATSKSVLKEGLIQAPIEAAEEAFQSIVSSEAELVGEGEIDRVFQGNFGERFGDYLMDEELWTSAFWGGIMGLGMPVAFDVIQNRYDKIPGFDRLLNKANKLENADDNTFKYETAKQFFATAFRKAAQGKMESFENDIKAKLEETTDPKEKEKLNQMLEDIGAFEEIFNKVQNKAGYSRQGKFENIKDSEVTLKTMEIANKWDLKKSTEALSKLTEEYDELLSKDNTFNSEYSEVKKLYELDKLYESGTLENEARAKQIKSELNKKYSEIGEFKDSNGKTITPEVALNSIYNNEISTNLAYQEELNNKIDNIKSDLPKFNTNKGRLELLKEHDSFLGKKAKEWDEQVMEFIGDGMTIVNDKGESYDIKRREDSGDIEKFDLIKTGDPDVPGGTNEELSDQEWDNFINNNEVTDERLISIANKYKNRDKLDSEEPSKREQAIYNANAEKIEELLNSNLENNDKNGFTRKELLDYMNGNNYIPADTKAYREKLLKRIDVELEQEYKSAISNLRSRIETLQEELATADQLREAEIEKEIREHNAKIRAYEIQIASLKKPLSEREKFIKEAWHLGDSAVRFYTNKINTLIRKRNSLATTANTIINVTKDLEKQLESLKNIYAETAKKTKDAPRGELKKRWKEYFKNLGADIRKIESKLNPEKEKLNKVQKEIDEIDEQIKNYEKKLDKNSRGEVLLDLKQKTDQLINAPLSEFGLKALIKDLTERADGVKEILNNIADDLIRLFGLKKEELTNKEKVDKVLAEAEKLNDPEIQEVINNAKRRLALTQNVKRYAQEIRELKKDLEKAEAFLREIKEIEDFGKPPPRPKKKPGKKEAPPTDNTPDTWGNSSFNIVGSYPLGGHQYLPNQKVDNVLNPSQAVRRYFKFVSDNDIAKMNLKVKLVPFKGNEMLIEDRDTLSDKVKDGYIIAILVDGNTNKPIGIDGKPINEENLSSQGIYTSLPLKYPGRNNVLEAFKIAEKNNKPIATYRDVTHKRTGILVGKEGTVESLERNYTPRNILKNPNNYELEIAYTNKIQIQGISIKAVPGGLYLRDLETGNVERLYSNKLGEEDKEVVKQILLFAQKNGLLNPFKADVIPGRTVTEALKELIHFAKPTKLSKGGVAWYTLKKVNGINTPFINLSGTEYELSKLTEKNIDDWLNGEVYYNIKAPRLGEKESYSKLTFKKEVGFGANVFDNYDNYVFDSGIVSTDVPPYDPDTTQRRNANIYIKHFESKEVSKKIPKEAPKKKNKTKNKSLSLREVMRGKKANSKKSSIPTEKKFFPKNPGEGNFGIPLGEGGLNRTITNHIKYKLENLEEAQKWFNERFPEVTFKIAYGLAKSGAWGRFTEHGQVLLDPGAEEGTIYHESFHVVSQLYLRSKERNAIYNQYRKATNFNGSDLEVEERLAEDFRDFVLSGELKDYSPKSWFQKLIDFLKWITGLSSPRIEEIFDNIQNGRYAKLKPNYSGITGFNRKIGFYGKTVGFTKEVVEGVNYMFWDAYPDGDFVKGIVDGNLNSELVGEVYERIYDRIIKYKKDLTTYIDDYYNLTADRVLTKEEEAALDAIEATEEDIGWIVDNFYTAKKGQSVVQKHKDFLASINIDVELPELTEEESANKDKDNQYAEIALNVSQKLTLSNEVKLWLSTIPKYVKVTEERAATENDVLEGKAGKVGDVIQVETAEVERNSLGFGKMYDFTTIFSILANKLAGITSVEEIAERFSELSKLDRSIDAINDKFFITTPDSKLSASKSLRKTKFFQAFTKVKNNYSMWIQLQNGTLKHFVTNDPALYDKIIGDWENGYSFKIGPGAKKIINSGGSFTFEQAQAQLERMGFDLPEDLNLDPVQEREFTVRTTQLTKMILQDEKMEIFDVDGPAITDIRRLAKLTYGTLLDYIENSHIGIDGKSLYNNSLYSYYSYVQTELNKIADAVVKGENGEALLYSKFPHFRDIYSQDSIILNKILKGEKIEVYIQEGIKKSDKSGTSYDRLSEDDILYSQINDVFEGRFHMLRPSDNKQERVFDFKTFVPLEDVANATDYLLDALKTELLILKERNADQKHINWKNYSDNLNLDTYSKVYEESIKNKTIDVGTAQMLNAGIVISMIASQEMRDLIGEYISGIRSLDEIINNSKVRDRINKWLNKTARNLEEIMLESQDLYVLDKEMSLKYLSRFFMVNYILSAIEQTKVFTGHPALYNNADDFFKRLNGVVGTGTVYRTDSAMNEYLEKFGVKNKDAVLSVAVVEDEIYKSKYYDTYLQELKTRYPSTAKDKMKPYLKVNKSDGGGLIHLDTYRELKIREGDWSWKQEKRYQWEVQGGWKGNKVVVPINNPFVEIAGEEITDVNEQGSFFPSIKPQYFGPLMEENNFILSYYKLALTPILPSIAENSNMGKLPVKNGIVIFESSNKVGTRLVSQNENDPPRVQPLYNEDGSVVDKLNFVNSDLRYWKNQVYNAPKQKFESSSGTQFLALVEAGIMDINEGPIDYDGDNWNNLSEKEKLESSELYRSIKQLRELTSARQNLGLKSLQKRFGVRLEGENYVIDNTKIDDVKEILRQEFIKRDLPENTVDSLQFIQHGIDVLVNRERIENMFMSIADKMTVSQKRFGKGSTQVSSVLFENIDSNYDQDGYRSDDLQFYDVRYKTSKGAILTQEQWDDLDKKPKDVEIIIGEMEVYLPHYFRELWGEDVDIKDIDSNLLGLIGFRIPTQALSSIENIRVKGFLPQSAGDIVVVPGELTTKTGGDFDFDKLFLHFPHYRMVKGKPRYIKYSDNPQWNNVKKDFIANDIEFAREKHEINKKYAKKLSQELFKEEYGIEELAEIFSFDTENSNVIDVKNIIQEWAYSRERMLDAGWIKADEKTVKDIESAKEIVEYLKDEVINPILALRETEIAVLEDKAKIEWDNLSTVEKNGRAAIENKMLELHKKLLSNKLRFPELISPIDTPIFEALANTVNELKGLSPVRYAFSNIVDPIFVIRKTVELQESKQNIGIAALGVKSNVLYGQVGAYINFERKPKLPVNEINGKPAIGFLKNKNKVYITDLLNEIASGYVDASTKSFMFHINGTLEGIPTLMAMIQLGVPEDLAVFIMNQPIIDEYLKMSSKRKSHFLDFADLKNYDFEEDVYQMFNTESQAVVDITNIKDLKKAIKDYSTKGELTEKQKRLQTEVLKEFKLFKEIGEHLRDATLGLSYDTQAGGKNTISALARVELTERVLNEGVIGNYDKIVGGDGFITAFRNSVKTYMDFFSPYIIHLNNKRAQNVMKAIVPFTRNLSRPLAERFINTYKADFITYLLHTQGDKNFYEENKRLILYKERTQKDGKFVFTYNENTVPRKIHEFQKRIKNGQMPSNFLIESFNVHRGKLTKNNERIDNLTLVKGKKLDTFDSNAFTEAWEELQRDYPQFAENLAKFIFMQSGLANSPMNFIHLVPNEIYFKILNEVLEKVDETESFNNFIHEFFLNNMDNRTLNLWKYRQKEDQIDNLNWPAWKIGRKYIYFTGEEGYVIDPKKISSKINFGKNTSLKVYRNESLMSYIDSQKTEKRLQKKMKVEQGNETERPLDSGDIAHQRSTNQEFDFFSFVYTLPKKDC